VTVTVTVTVAAGADAAPPPPRRDGGDPRSRFRWAASEPILGGGEL